MNSCHCWRCSAPSPPARPRRRRSYSYRICKVARRYARSTRPAPGRSRTSSTSCRRTAASTISFKGIRAPIPFRAARTPAVKRSRCSRFRSKINTRSITPRRAMFAACNGTGALPGTHCRMNGFDKEFFSNGPRSVKLPSTSTCRTRIRSRTSTWRMNGWSPTACSNRSSTRASSPPIRHRRAGGFERRSAGGSLGLRGRPERCRRDAYARTASYGPTIVPCFDYQTLGDELDRAQPLMAILRQHVRQPLERRRGVLVELPGRQAHLLRAGLEERRDRTELEVHHRRARRQARELHLDHAGLRRLRSRELRRRLRSVVGRGARQHRRQEQVLELDRDLRAVGRLGRSLRSRPAALSKITTASAFAFRCSSSRRTPRRTTSRTCSTRRRACCASPRISSA